MWTGINIYQHLKLSSVLVENYNAAPFHSAKVTFAKEILRDIQQMKMHLHKGHWLLSKGHHRDRSDRHHVNNNDTELSLSSVAIAKWDKYWGVLWWTKCYPNSIFVVDPFLEE